MLPNQTSYNINHQGGRPNNVSDLNSGIDNGTNINKCYNGYSGVNINKNGDTDNRINVALGSNKDN